MIRHAYRSYPVCDIHQSTENYSAWNPLNAVYVWSFISSQRRFMNFSFLLWFRSNLVISELPTLRGKEVLQYHGSCATTAETEVVTAWVMTLVSWLSYVEKLKDNTYTYLYKQSLDICKTCLIPLTLRWQSVALCELKKK